MREKLKQTLLKLLDLEPRAKECLKQNGIPYTIKLYNRTEERCCYNGDCPAQKEDIRPYRPFCKLYWPDTNGGSS